MLAYINAEKFMQGLAVNSKRIMGFDEVIGKCIGSIIYNINIYIYTIKLIFLKFLTLIFTFTIIFIFFKTKGEGVLFSGRQVNPAKGPPKISCIGNKYLNLLH